MAQDIYKLNTRKRQPKPPQWKIEPGVCRQCGNGFERIRQAQVYCSRDCRDTYWAENRRWLPDPETVTLEELAEFMSGYLRMVRCLPGHGKIELEY